MRSHCASQATKAAARSLAATSEAQGAYSGVSLAVTERLRRDREPLEG